MTAYALTAVAILNDDLLKILLMAGVGIGLLALGRWSSRLGAATQDHPANLPMPDVGELTPQYSPTPETYVPGPEEIAASFPFDPALGKLRITKFFFDKHDVIPGPENPRAFADELHVEIYDPDSGNRWWQAYFIATPDGLADVLRERSWKFLFAPQILVFPEYDLEEIRRAVVSRIKADHEFFSEDPDAAEESL
jgi:hypothetical protein